MFIKTQRETINSACKVRNSVLRLDNRLWGGLAENEISYILLWRIMTSKVMRNFLANNGTNISKYIFSVL